jgi:nucleotide sugar dehydrogenase
MNTLKIGVIGLGFVGTSIQKSLDLKKCITKGYDKYKDSDSYISTLNSDIIFLCLPTIFDEQKNEYDKSCIIEVCKDLENDKYHGLVVIKSTVEPKTTDNLSELFPNLKLIHNPEFLTAATAFEDFHNQKHIVLGKSSNVSDNDINLLKEFYKYYYPDADISISTSLESESMKSFVNCFYSVKIQFFNELYALCKKTKCDYDTVKKLMLKNGWINPMHTDVPGIDGQASYGGYCFPKDTNALLEFMKSEDSPCEVLEATVSERNKMRQDHTNVKLDKTVTPKSG